jgi:nicotinate-nucleotide pyrophosphorylase (carboxylating)
MHRLPDLLLEPMVRAALAEDLGRAGDVTARLVAGARMQAVFNARKDGVLAGLDCARLAMAAIDPAVEFETALEDGAKLKPGAEIARVSGAAPAILTGERTALNFLTHLSGVATLAAQFVAAVAGTGARIAATRKTLPGLRSVQKAAAVAGGAWPHRYGLDDAILIKDNHIVAAGGVAAALKQAREMAGHMMVIEVEVDRLSQLEEALAFAPHAVLLDNFGLADLAAAVKIAKGRTILEASGGVSLATVRAIAETGVDVISVGALTHSAPALDIGLDAVP